MRDHLWQETYSVSGGGKHYDVYGFLYTVTVYLDILFREVKKKKAHSNLNLIIFAFRNVIKPFLKQCSVLSEE